MCFVERHGPIVRASAWHTTSPKELTKVPKTKVEIPKVVLRRRGGVTTRVIRPE